MKVAEEKRKLRETTRANTSPLCTGDRQRREEAQSLRGAESGFRGVLHVAAICLVILLAVIFVTLVIRSMVSLKVFGLAFLFNRTWDPVNNQFGALPFLVGTLATSFLALILALPFSLAISLFLGEYLRDGAVPSFLRSAVELLAGIPSVVYGFWGLFVLAPIVRSFQTRFDLTPYGVGILTASLVLAIMIIPYAASLGREVIQLVPQDLKEAALSLGATRFEVVKNVVLPHARSGIMAGAVLALGRALGETMAVTMVIGNANLIPRSPFSPANTMASVIANQFAEATGDVYVSSLIQIALWLFVVTAVVNIIGRHILKRFVVEP